MHVHAIRLPMQLANTTVKCQPAAVTAVSDNKFTLVISFISHMSSYSYIVAIIPHNLTNCTLCRDSQFSEGEPEEFAEHLALKTYVPNNNYVDCGRLNHGRVKNNKYVLTQTEASQRDMHRRYLLGVYIKY